LRPLFYAHPINNGATAEAKKKRLQRVIDDMEKHGILSKIDGGHLSLNASNVPLT